MIGCWQSNYLTLFPGHQEAFRIIVTEKVYNYVHLLYIIMYLDSGKFTATNPWQPRVSVSGEQKKCNFENVRSIFYHYFNELWQMLLHTAMLTTILQNVAGSSLLAALHSNCSTCTCNCRYLIQRQLIGSD